MSISRRASWLMVATAILLGFGVVANPWIRTLDQVFVIEILAACGWLAYEFWRAARCDLRSKSIPAPVDLVEHNTSDPNPRGISYLATASLLVISLLWAFVYRIRWLAPRRMPDDDVLYADAVDWPTAWQRLLVPMVDHVMVPTRIVTYLMLKVGDESARDAIGAVVSGVLFLSCLPLLFLLARREWQSEFAGLVAVSLFALSSTYAEIILWYTASCQWLITLMLMLTSLLLAGSPNPTRVRITLASLCALIAPLNFSAGVIVGPVTTLWMAVRSHTVATRAAKSRWILMLWPLAGTVVGTGLTALLLTQSATDKRWYPGLGMALSARLTIDVLILRNLGQEVLLPKSWHLVVFPLVPLALTILLRLRTGAWRLLPMVTMIVLTYALTIPFRTWVAYPHLVNWTRYHLIPQLGLALLLVDAFGQLAPRLHGRLMGHLSFSTAGCLLGFVLLLTWLHYDQVR